MLKKNRIWLLVPGIVLMILSIVLFGFVETDIPPVVYFCAWAFSFKVVNYSVI